MTFPSIKGGCFSWNNGQKGQARRLARLDRFYTPKHNQLEIKHSTYFIHGYLVGSNHLPVQIELCIGRSEAWKSAFKWNVAHLKWEIEAKLSEKCISLPKDVSFLYKLRHITRYYRQYSKQKAKKKHKWEELNTRAKLKVAMASLHNDIYNVGKQGEVNQLKSSSEDIEMRTTRGAAIRSRVEWQKVGDKRLADFSKLVSQKNTQSIVSKLRDNQGRCFTKREKLEKICLDFYTNLYQYKKISENHLKTYKKTY